MNPFLLLAGGGVLLVLFLKGKSTRDPNTPPDVAQAVSIALAVEKNPKNLRSFAASLTPYPHAQAALNAQAQKLGG
jgi:hypothetical protein